VPQYSAEVIPLPYPRTVCTSKTCTSIVFVEGKRKVDYKTHCHEHCYLRGVEQEVIKNSALKKCAAMNWKLGMYKDLIKKAMLRFIRDVIIINETLFIFITKVFAKS
jgi:hypothetical protein